MILCFLLCAYWLPATAITPNNWYAEEENFQNLHYGKIHPRSHLTQLDVVCSKHYMTVNMEFDEPFYGVVFSYPSTKHERCVHVGAETGIKDVSFHIPYDGCGTIEDRVGHFHENTIVVQYEADILEAWDEAKKLRCEWIESLEKPTENQQVVIADLDVIEMHFKGDDIGCWMEIQEGKGPWAREVSGLVPLGSPLTLVIAINDESRQFDMRVKQCEAYDDTGSTIQLTDHNGCVLKPRLITKFAKVKDYSNKATLIAYSHVYAFKFPDKLDVYIQCIVEVCRHGCVESCSGESNHHQSFSIQGKLRGVNQAYLSQTNDNNIPQPEPNSVAHPHHVTSERLIQEQLHKLQHSHVYSGESLLHEHLQKSQSQYSTSEVPFNVPQPEPNSFAHPHHVTSEKLFQEQLQELQQHSHDISDEELNQPQPEPNTAAHPHYISSERLVQQQLQGLQNLHESFHNRPSETLSEPGSAAHPHYISGERLIQEQLQELQKFHGPFQDYSVEPQPEPNSAAHPHHITSEEYVHEQLKHLQDHSHRVLNIKQTEPQPEPNSAEHPHYASSEEIIQEELLKLQQFHGSDGSLSLEQQLQLNEPSHPQNAMQNLRPFQGQQNVLHSSYLQSELLQDPRMALPQQIRAESYVVNEPHIKLNGHSAFLPQSNFPFFIPENSSYKTVELKYVEPEFSTLHPVYLHTTEINSALHSSGKQFKNHHQPPIIEKVKEIFKKHSQNFPYPVPQFSPRQQIMMSIIADRRNDDDAHSKDPRVPIVNFSSQADGRKERTSYGPRNLRVKRSEPVFEVRQKFRAIAPSDLAFDLNTTKHNTAILNGRREEIVYGICMSPTTLSVGLGMMLLFTLSSLIVAAILYQYNLKLQNCKRASTITSVFKIFNGNREHLYQPGSSGYASTDILEIK